YKHLLTPPEPAIASTTATQPTTQPIAPTNIADLPDAGKIVTLTYVRWPGAIAAVNVVKAVLHNKLGFTVRIKAVSASLMWKAVAQGSADGFLAAWLPTLHKVYYRKFQT